MISDNTYIYNHDKIERIFKMMAKACDENINNYSLNKMVSYDCKGYDLTGSNANMHDPRRHFLVKNNHYTVYEIPSKSNKGLRLTGKFLVLIYNRDFDHWYFTLMTHRLYKNSNNIVIEDVNYQVGGEFRITECNNSLSWVCISSGNRCCRGFKTKVFDSDNIRKEKGYHTTMKIINKRFGIESAK